MPAVLCTKNPCHTETNNRSQTNWKDWVGLLWEILNSLSLTFIKEDNVIYVPCTDKAINVACNIQDTEEANYYFLKSDIPDNENNGGNERPQIIPLEQNNSNSIVYNFDVFSNRNGGKKRHFRYILIKEKNDRKFAYGNIITFELLKTLYKRDATNIGNYLSDSINDEIQNIEALKNAYNDKDEWEKWKIIEIMGRRDWPNSSILTQYLWEGKYGMFFFLLQTIFDENKGFEKNLNYDLRELVDVTDLLGISMIITLLFILYS